MNIDREAGYTQGVRLDPLALGTSPRYVSESLDPNPDLRFPLSVLQWDTMRRTDDQVGAVLRAVTLPIRRAPWTVEGADVRPEVLEFVRSELGIPQPGEGRRRQRRHGVTWSEHLRAALLCLPLGFMAFEQVYQPELGGAWAERLGLPGVIHLRKLAPRMPATITDIRTGRDGGLVGIVQQPEPGAELTAQAFRDNGIFIPVDRLVMYVNEMEGADWSGTSILRTAYRAWYLKDQLVRVDAQAAERNGMGVPVITYQGEEQRERAEQIGRDFRAGARAYLALPDTMQAQLLGVSGGTHDVLSSVKHHDQQIAKSVLAMFLDLGHDSGARALGDTFTDTFTDSLQAVADQIADTATEHIIRDLVELNFGLSLIHI